MAKQIIGVVGEKGSGKGTFANLLTELLPNKKITRTTFSNVLKETMDLWDIPPTRENFQKLVVLMRENFDADVLAHAVKKNIEKLDGDILVVDGMRWKVDGEMIKNFPQSLIVYVTADQKIRYERTKARGEKEGEKDASFEEFMDEEKAPAEIEIPDVVKKADFTINNDGSVDEFRAQVKDFIEKFMKV